MIDPSTLSHKDLCELCVSLKQQRDELLLANNDAIECIDADLHHGPIAARQILIRARHKAEKTNVQRSSIANER